LLDQRLSQGEHDEARHALQVMQRRLLDCSNPDDTPNAVKICQTISAWIRTARAETRSAAFDLRGWCMAMHDGFATLPPEAFVKALQDRYNPKGSQERFDAAAAALVVDAGLKQDSLGREEAIAKLLGAVSKKRRRP
jgi:hypothetical protein